MGVAKTIGRRGWRQWREDDARAALAEWDASGLSLAAFAQRKGVSPTRLRNWRRRLGDAAPVRFVPIAHVAPATGVLELTIGGVVLRVREDLAEARLARIVAALRAALPSC